ncbi:unnamed protein product [Staurois parvus]|uniref:Secreted protein n=1 Tax=Staurois parvus TaxID=386267 RepID=A0ABN9H9U1_9NEOB|nr:unnamed protein product [Staurois parvus]
MFVYFLQKLQTCLYLPASCSSFAQSSLGSSLLVSPAGTPGLSLLLGASTARSLLWGHPLLCVPVHTWSSSSAPPFSLLVS